MLLALAVAAAAGLGAVARYLLDQFVGHWVSSEFPYGTLVINVSGSLVLGLVLGLAMHHGLTNAPTTVIGAGFAGGYTTLSTWAYETLVLAEEREYRQAAINVVASAGLGLAAAAAGFALALL
ncbi:MAG TPA: fluoride efflux transporter CrcB [Jatrophihabitantaceae bacterium]|jgi:CrcB protein